MLSRTISVHKTQYKLSIKAIRDVVHMEAMQAGCVTEQCYLLFVVGHRNADCGSIRKACVPECGVIPLDD